MSVTRQIVFGIAPFDGVAGTYSWPQVGDFNSDEHLFTCAYVPEAESGNYTGLQESLFLGTQILGKTIQTFLNDEVMDDSSGNVSAEAITARIDPTVAMGGAPDAKNFIYIDFAQLDCVAKGLTFDYVTDKEDVVLTGQAWTDMYSEAGMTRVFFPDGIARWVHIRIVDDTEECNRDVFGSFLVNYYSLEERDGQESV